MIGLPQGDSPLLRSTSCTITANLEVPAGGVGRPGAGAMKVDGQEFDTKSLPRGLPMILQWGERFDIGSNPLSVKLDAAMRAKD